MDTALQTALLLLVLLQFKHLVADFFLQTPRMLAGRAAYLHWGRVEHAGLHAILSLIAFVALGAPVGFVVALCFAEFVVHFHIDWLKGYHSEKKPYGPDEARYWYAFGVDQMMHQLTYVAMLWIWALYLV
ncbi:DUF3307 domain containing protein [Sulfitobacter noctilucae]|uniref:DUF3307 domain-containing protein n=1 Tax=Sulfitobacter noctilucae TaxID=1342302 RepID=UPI00046A8C7F|nr:DUF3307 domain-containing protein [Sulfitobacter noctilucae]KIN65523.1 DUF3307 domain containing protein [Sulfitobacter noctilucae]